MDEQEGKETKRTIWRKRIGDLFLFNMLLMGIKLGGRLTSEENQFQRSKL